MPTWELTLDEARCLVMVFAGMMGACFGSFLSVCIWRIPRGESIVLPRSHCPNCNKLIPWYHNIPVLSWLALGGKCASCKTKISPRYLLLELLTAGLFLAAAWRFCEDPLVMLLMWLVVFGLELGTFIDLDWYILPDRVTIGGMVVGVAASAFLPQLHGENTWLGGLVWSGIGLAAGFGVLYLVSVVGKAVYKKEAMGFGDVKLMGAVGAFFGWQAVVFTLFVSSLLGSLVGIGLIVAKKRDLQGKIPYGPFIAAAAILWMLAGHGLARWYLALLK